MSEKSITSEPWSPQSEPAEPVSSPQATEFQQLLQTPEAQRLIERQKRMRELAHFRKTFLRPANDWCIDCGAKVEKHERGYIVWDGDRREYRRQCGKCRDREGCGGAEALA